MDAVKRLNKAIALCVAEGDNTSRDLLEEILESEEEHVDWLETQLGLIKTARRVGVSGRADAQVTGGSGTSGPGARHAVSRPS